MGQMPTWDRYCMEPGLAGPFENMLLYTMCRDNPSHDSPYVTAGKITAIGRIYAAAPERGAGSSRRDDVTLAHAIAQRLVKSQLDGPLAAIGFDDRFSETLKPTIVSIHGSLVNEVATVTREWSIAADQESWKPRNQMSFVSKYLHFHRPNAFPIMDSFAKAGLSCYGLIGPFAIYDAFCSGLLRYIVNLEDSWTPRSVDTALVARGRLHASRAKGPCPVCGNVPRGRNARIR